MFPENKAENRLFGMVFVNCWYVCVVEIISVVYCAVRLSALYILGVSV